MAYENGELEEPEVIALFQFLLDSGMVYHLQGSYQRMAEELADGLSMISAQIHPRQNIRKTPAAPNLFESFETLTAQESVESPALVQSQEDIANSANITTSTETNGSSGADGGYT